MRLLQYSATGKFIFTKDLVGDDQIPSYAILSHTWGLDTDEVTFEDVTKGTDKDKAGYEKIQFCGEQAREDGLQYFWIDTCCINKANYTELSQAINSMFRWYHDATRCYVYLPDVPSPAIVTNEEFNPRQWESDFQKSRWFTRGWTLQELLAPSSVEFFSRDRRRLGDKRQLGQKIHEITGIAISALQGAHLSQFSVEERLSWIDGRQTRLEEDKVYSLLGIFDIHMPLIYGEGAEKAFSRLQEEIYKHLRKHQLDDLSATFNSRKRLTTSRSLSSSFLSRHDSNFLDSEPPSFSEYSMSSNDLPETQKEPVGRVNDSIGAAIKQSLIKKLYFTKIDERLTNLTAAQGTTCRWFLTKPEYTSWHDLEQQPGHGGFLWIKGNPGTGKSTLMKLLFEEAKLNTKGNSSQITLSFFFLAQGTAEEKLTTGLYRSLLHQLFEKAVGLQDSLDWITHDGAKVIQRDGWSEEALKQTLKHAIQKLEKQSLMIFVDALDECDKNQAAGMICFFEDLSDRAREAEVQLQICFSSRHYPTIVIQKGIEVTLEDEIGHMEDIKQYIKSKLRLHKSEQAESLRSKILEKSSGIFLWVVLVLNILNSEYPDSSISIKKIHERLKEIPQKLSDLFGMILMRDRENLERLQLCLKWILFATRPLKPQELYFAIQLGLDKECSSFWDQEDVELDQIKTFVRSSSKGLAEVTRNKASEVQFIHESVRDFLLGKYKGQWFTISSNPLGYGHEILKNCCLAQLNASIKQDIDIPDPLPQASEAAQLREIIKLKFPFLEYSVRNILHHANYAQQNAVEQVDFLADFPLQQWIFLSNVLQRHDNQRYTKSVSLLYILAEKNLADLIRIYPRRESCDNIESERYGLPIFAALATRSHKAVQIFLEVHADLQLQEPLLRRLYEQYSENRNESPNFGNNFTFSRQKNIFSHLVEQGNEVILTFLCALGTVDVESRDKRGQTPLLWAAEKGNEALAKLLLDKGADLETQDKTGQTPLSLAAREGHEALVKLLLEKGADLEAQDESSQTPLSWAAEKGHEVIVKMLLEKGADLETQDESSQTPLSLAAEKGHEALVKLLLEKGADLETQDESSQTPLSLAVEKGHDAVVKLLLEKGADLEAQNESSQTPLLDTGRFDVDSKDKEGRAPLL